MKLLAHHDCRTHAAMRCATFPPIRIEPKLRADVEAVLREGESLTQFIEDAVVAAAAGTRSTKSWTICRLALMTPGGEPLSAQAGDDPALGHAIFAIGAVRHQREDDYRH